MLGAKDQRLTSIDIHLLPGFFEQYRWGKNHPLYGYPADTYPGFKWIKSLEERGAWLASQETITVAPTNLIRELLDWGEGANGPRTKFEAGLGNVSLIDLIRPVISEIQDPAKAIMRAMAIPGCGLTYASKLLRFMRADVHASLDNRIREALFKAGLLPDIQDSSKPSMMRGYVEFLTLINGLIDSLEDAGVVRPECDLPKGANKTGWRVADVEMALFAWADRRLQKAKAKQVEQE